MMSSALSAADWNHGVDSLDTGLQRLVHRLTEDHARSLALGEEEESALPSIGPLPSIGSPSMLITRPNKPSPTGMEATSPVRRTDMFSVTEFTLSSNTTPTLLSSRVKSHAFGAVLKLHELVTPDIVKTVDMRHAVADAQHKCPPPRISLSS